MVPEIVIELVKELKSRYNINLILEVIYIPKPIFIGGKINRLEIKYNMDSKLSLLITYNNTLVR